MDKIKSIVLFLLGGIVFRYIVEWLDLYTMHLSNIKERGTVKIQAQIYEIGKSLPKEYTKETQDEEEDPQGQMFAIGFDMSGDEEYYDEEDSEEEEFEE